MKKDNLQPFFFFLASAIFCFGFLIVLINGYYLYTYQEFINTGRKDLIVRLVFLSNTTGLIYYPTVIIPIALITWIAKSKQNLKGKVIWLSSTIAIIFIGILFYTNTINNLISLSKGKLIFGLFIIGLSIPIYWNKELLKKRQQN